MASNRMIPRVMATMVTAKLDIPDDLVLAQYLHHLEMCLEMNPTESAFKLRNFQNLLVKIVGVDRM